MKELVNQSPEARALLQKVKDMSRELKEKQVAISDYALEVERMGNRTQIERGGVTYDIIKSAKLVKHLQ